MIARRTFESAVVTALLFVLCAGHSLAQTPSSNLAATATKTDRVLFQEAMNAMKHSRYGDARQAPGNTDKNLS